MKRTKKNSRRALLAPIFLLAATAAFLCCVMTVAGWEPEEDVLILEPQIVYRDVPERQEQAAPPAEDWNLILVNPWNMLPDDYELTLTELSNGHAVDERCYPSLQRMMDDCRAEGLKPVICSSYRTQEKQQALFDRQVNGFLSRGYSRQNAYDEAAKIVAVPGTSEHQLGLAVDIVDLSNQNLDESQEDTPVQRWLMENSWRYGFILRYPDEKSGITGIIYEPWHYRYVGEAAAKEIFEQDVCLEEYLEQLGGAL